jgi:hypothetical protein
MQYSFFLAVILSGAKYLLLLLTLILLFPFAVILSEGGLPRAVSSAGNPSRRTPIGATGLCVRAEFVLPLCPFVSFVVNRLDGLPRSTTNPFPSKTLEAHSIVTSAKRTNSIPGGWGTTHNVYNPNQCLSSRR